VILFRCWLIFVPARAVSTCCLLQDPFPPPRSQSARYLTTTPKVRFCNTATKPRTYRAFDGHVACVQHKSWTDQWSINIRRGSPMLQRRRLRNQILQVRSPRWPKCEADETLEALRRPNPRWGFILGGERSKVTLLQSGCTRPKP
jgi:hypothetical protein